MKNLCLRILGLVMMLFVVTNLFGQQNEFNLRFNFASQEYEVYVRPNLSNSNFFVGGGSQLSIVVPESIGNIPFSITTENGGLWFDNSNIFAPAADPEHDFHSIASNGSFINLQIDQELLLFKFQLPGGCLDGVRLFENDSDPQSTEPGMLGGDFNNYFANVLTLQDTYLQNYNNDGVKCDSDGDGLTDTEELTGIDDPSTPTVATGTSDPNDPCDPDLFAVLDGDCDGDGLTNEEEDTNGNGLCDSTETCADDADTDDDGINDGEEVAQGSNPLDPCDPNPTAVANGDCDGDGVTNGQEVVDNTSPTDPCEFNPDSQSITNASADWNNLDCDEDGISNGTESGNGSDPNDICDPLGPTLDASSSYTLNPDCSPSDLILNAGLIAPLGIITSIEWTGPNGWTAFVENPIIENVTEDFNGNYMVSIIDENGCTASDVINVQGIINTVTQPLINGDGSTCSGESITLSVSEYEGSSVVYNWTYPGTGSNITGIGTNEITIQPVQAMNEGDYSVEVTVDGTCILQSNFYAVVIYDDIEVSTENDGVECITLDTDLNLTTTVTGGSGDYTALWTGPENFISVDVNPVIPNANDLSSGTYTVTVTDANGCTAASSTVVDVTLVPETPVLMINNNSLCIGGSLQLETSPYNGANVIYTWTLSGTNNAVYTTEIPSFTMMDIDIDDAGLYTVSVSINGCPSLVSGEELVTVGTAPEAPVLLSNFSVCEGEDVILTTSTVAQNYHWTGPNGFTASEQNPEAITDMDVSKAGTYTLVIENDGCLSEPETVFVNLELLPEVPTLSMANSICEGEDIVLSAFGNPGYSYQWISPSSSVNSYFGELGNPNNVVWTNANTTTISLADHPQFYESGTWMVRAVSPSGCFSDVSVPQELSINSIPAEALVSNSGPVCFGESVQLFTNTIANAEYKWFNNDPYATPNIAQLISIEQNPIISDLSLGDHSFYLTVNVSGCTPSVASKTDVSITDVPEIGAVSNTGPYCEGDMIYLHAVTVPGVSYSWIGPNGFSSSQEDPVIPNGQAAVAGSYTLTISSPSGLCTSSPMTTVVDIISTPSTPVASNTGPSCEGSSIQLIGNNVPTGSNVVYEWTGPNGFISNVQNPVISNVSTDDIGDYAMTVVVDGCSSNVSTATTITVGEIPAAPIAGNNTSSENPACEGTDIQLETEFIPGATYEWVGPDGFEATGFNPVISNVDLNNQGEYLVFITINGCTSMGGTTTVYTQPAASVPVATNDGPICIGEDLTLNVNNVDPNATYQWFDSITNQLIDSGAQLELSDLDEEDSGTYYVIATLNGCETGPDQGSSAYSVVAVHEPSEDEAFVGADLSVCEDEVDISAFVVSDWKGRWSILDGGTDTRIVNPNLEATRVLDLAIGENTFLWSIESGACGITSEDTLMVSYELAPTAENDLYVTNINTPVVENMVDNDLLNSADVLVDLVEEPEHGNVEVNSDGSFEYTPSNGFTGTDEFTYQICNVNCLDNCSQATVRFEIGLDAECVTPQVITPDDDGVNDAFIVPCLENYKGSTISIFNRWGDEVYQSQNYQNDWKGTYNGDPLPVGTYYYILKINDGNNTLVTGFVFIQL